jgi:hypothetical protein
MPRDKLDQDASMLLAALLSSGWRGPDIARIIARLAPVERKADQPRPDPAKEK